MAELGSLFGCDRQCPRPGGRGQQVNPASAILSFAGESRHSSDGYQIVLATLPHLQYRLRRGLRANDFRQRKLFVRLHSRSVAMAWKFAVTLHKGGVGKSTTTVNLAGVLAEQGKRILLIDCDSQGDVS